MSRRQGYIEERSPGHWLVRYSVNEPGGRRRFSTTIKGTKRDAERELRRRLDAIDQGAHVDPTRMTVGEWLARWLDAARAEISPKTHERYAEIVKYHLAATLGPLPLAKLAPMHIADCYASLASGGRRDGKSGGLSAQTRRHVHRVLHTALARAVEQQLLARNPAEAFRRRLPKVERAPMTTLTPEQSRQLLSAVRHSHIYWPVLLSISTGMRRGEVLALRWRDIDLDHGAVRVVQSLEQTRGGLRFKTPKSGKTRPVALPAHTVAELRRLKVEQAQALLRLGVRQDATTLVCCRADSEPLQPQSLTHEFPRFLARLGPEFPKIGFHSLRHTHASQLLTAGVHPKVVQERLGHATIGITLDTYSHLIETMQSDAAAKIDEITFGHNLGHK
jgi:integrase